MKHILTLLFFLLFFFSSLSYGQLDTLKPVPVTRYQAWEFETCDEACKEVVIIKCHCEICYRRGQCYTWRFDPSQKNAIKSAKARAKSGLK